MLAQELWERKEKFKQNSFIALKECFSHETHQTFGWYRKFVRVAVGMYLDFEALGEAEHDCGAEAEQPAAPVQIYAVRRSRNLEPKSDCRCMLYAGPP